MFVFAIFSAFQFVFRWDALIGQEKVLSECNLLRAEWPERTGEITL